MASSAKLTLVLAFLAVCLIWGSTFFAILVGLETIPPFFLAGARFVTAGGILYAVARLRGAPPPTPVEWRNTALIGVLLCSIGNGLVTLSEQWVSSSLAAIMIATIPLWTAIFAALRGQSTSMLERVALAIGFFSVALLNLGGDLEAAGLLGSTAILIAPIAWAFGSVKSRELSMPGGLMSSGAQMLVGGTVLIAAGVAIGEEVPKAVSMRSLLALGYLVVFGSIVAFSAYGFLLRTTRPAVATAYAYVNPLVAMVLGATFAGEELGAGTVLSAVGIISSVALLGAARLEIFAAERKKPMRLALGAASPRK